MLVYDVTNRASFDALSEWLIEMRDNLPQPSDMDSVVFVVCANKVCPPHTRQIVVDRPWGSGMR